MAAHLMVWNLDKNIFPFVFFYKVREGGIDDGQKSTVNKKEKYETKWRRKRRLSKGREGLNDML